MIPQPQEEWKKIAEIIISIQWPTSPVEAKGFLWRLNKKWVKTVAKEIDAHYSSQTKEIVERLENIREWPEPQKGAGKEIGPLAGMGMYLQYDNDRKKHTKQIDNVIEAVRGEK